VKIKLCVRKSTGKVHWGLDLQTLNQSILHSLKTLPSLLVMPVQRPFNEDALWQGAIQRANYPPSRLTLPPMILPKISQNGGTVKDPTAPPIWEQITQSYTKYSKNYWSGVKRRQEVYRRENSYPMPEFSPPYKRTPSRFFS